MSANSAYADWIAVDWGTSQLRAWAIRGGKSIAAVSSDRGMATLSRHEFEPALLDLIGPWLGSTRINVMACGMVGSRQGWAEAAYTAVPTAPQSGRPTAAAVKDPRLAVHIMPGLKQDKPADVMRGEETQIAGFLAQQPGFDGVIAMPGTHTKWVQISAGEVVSFRTAMTGEMFSLLKTQSVLRHSTGTGWDADAFRDAVSDAMSRPEALAANLFSLRAETLLHDAAPAAITARLSGLLIGAELASTRPYWLGQDIALIGNAALSERYCTALELQGLTPRIIDVTEATLGGLAIAHATLEETLP